MVGMNVGYSGFSGLGGGYGGMGSPYPSKQPTLPGRPDAAVQGMPSSGQVNEYDASRLNAGLASGLQGQGATERQGQTTLEAKLQSEADARHLAAIQGLMAQYGGHGAASAPSVPPMTASPMADQENAVRASIFARSKDQAGNLAGAQMRGLNEAMAGRGIAGSGMEALGAAGVLGGARGGLDQLNTDQMTAELQRAAALSDRNYSGGLTQRGQDITQRGQDLQAQQAALQNLMSMFSVRY